MNSAFVSAWASLHTAAIWLANRLFRVQASEGRCISVLGNRSVTLPSEFPSSAAELQVEFTMRWPILSWRHRRSVRVRLLSTEGHALLREDEWHKGERLRWRATDVRITLPALPAVAESKFRLEILREPQGTPLRTLEFQVLAPDRARRLVLETLRVENRQFWIACGSQRYRSDRVASTSDSVAPELTIASPALAAFVPPLELFLTLHLATGNRRTLLSQMPITLSERPLALTGPPVPVRGTPLAEPGPYALVATLEDREIATFQFQTVGEKELLQQVRVARTHVYAELLRDGSVRPVRVLRWQEHESVQVCVDLETDWLAPNSAFRCWASILQDGITRHREEFEVRIDKPSLRLVLERLSLRGFGLQGRPSRLTILVQVGSEQKTAVHVSIRPNQPVANFEGRLNADPKQLPFDNAEYGQILKNLGVPDTQPSRRRFQWRRPEA